MQRIRWAILLLGVIVLLAAMIQNSGSTTLKLFFYETQLPVSVLLLVTSASSFLIGAITTGRMLKRAAKAKRMHEKTEKPAEKQVIVESKATPVA